MPTSTAFAALQPDDGHLHRPARTGRTGWTTCRLPASPQRQRTRRRHTGGAGGCSLHRNRRRHRAGRPGRAARGRAGSVRVRLVARCTERHRLAVAGRPDGVRPDADRHRRRRRGDQLAGWRPCRPRSPGTGRACCSRRRPARCPPSGRSTNAPSSATPTPAWASEPSFFAGPGRDGGPERRSRCGSPDSLRRGAAAADAAYAELGAFLRTELRPPAPAKDAVGRERYVLASRDFLGATIDLEETYAWGWQEFLAIEAELIEVAERIAPGAGPAGAAAALDADPDYQINGLDALRSWMQDLSDRAVADLSVANISTSRSRSGRWNA